MILFYEDEPYWMSDYFDVLDEHQIPHISFENGQKCFEYLKTNYSNIKYIVVDIMVYGPGNKYTKDPLETGKESGLYFVNKIAEYEDQYITTSSTKPKIMILTNRRGEVLNELLKNKRISLVLRKKETTVKRFLTEITK